MARTQMHWRTPSPLADLAETRKLLDLATETLDRAVTASTRLVAIGEAIAARRLLDEVKQAIDRAASMARRS